MKKILLPFLFATLIALLVYTYSKDLLAYYQDGPIISDSMYNFPGYPNDCLIVENCPEPTPLPTPTPEPTPEPTDSPFPEDEDDNDGLFDPLDDESEDFEDFDNPALGDPNDIFFNSGSCTLQGRGFNAGYGFGWMAVLAFLGAITACRCLRSPRGL